MTDIEVRVTIGAKTTGVWCPHCRLPSAVTASVYGFSGDTILPLGVFTVCQDCQQFITPNPTEVDHDRAR